MASVPGGVAPPPPSVSCTINPLLDILTAFPVPQLVASSALQNGEARREYCSVGMTCEESIANSVEESARGLVGSSSYDVLCEATGCLHGNALVSQRGEETHPTLSPLARRIHERLLQLERSRQTKGAQSVRGGYSLRNGRVPWERQPTKRMNLRAHRDFCEEMAESHKEGGIVHEPRCCEPPVKSRNSTRAGGELGVERRYCLEVTDIINECLVDSKSLDILFGILSSTAHPFKDVNGEAMTAFLVRLMQPVVSSQLKRKSVATEEVKVSVALMERVIVCCSCVSHPSFDLSHLPEDMVNNLITIFAALLRRASRRTFSHLERDQDATAELRCLRAVLDCFCALVCDRRLDVCSRGDLARLEELCFQCLFVTSSNCEHQDATTYAAYAMSHALQLYTCLWNHLRHQRGEVMERFFLQLPLTPNLLLRLQQLPSGEKVMALTVAIVGAAQSLVVGTETIGLRDAEVFGLQCRAWATKFVQHFVLVKRDQQDRDTLSTVVLQFAEDLAHMLGLPEYPGADIILQSLLGVLTHHTPVAAAVTGEKSVCGLSIFPLFVDVIYRVSRVVFGGSLQSLRRIKVPLASRLLTPAQVKQWCYLTNGEVDKELKDNDDGDGASYGDMREGYNAQVGVSDCRAVVYTALSRSLNGTPSNSGDVLFHVRAAHVLTWAQYDKCFHELAVDRLVRSRHIVEGGVSVDKDILRACTVRLSAEREESLLNMEAKDRLLSLLFSVFQAWEEEPQYTLTGLEIARKKVLSYIGVLIELHAPLLDRVWPIVQRCARCDSARVREATIALLLVVLSGACRGNRQENCLTEPLVTEMITDIVSMLLHLLSDQSVLVSSRAIAALDTLLTEEPYAELLERIPKLEHLVTFTQAKLLTLVGPTAVATVALENQQRAALRRLFVRRWTLPLSGDVEERHTHIRVAKELLRLTTSTVKYPHDAPESLHLVTLLREMCHGVAAGGDKYRGAKGSKGPKGHGLCRVMVGVAKTLWAEWQRLSPRPQGTAALATIHILSMACIDWVDPLLGALAQVLLHQQQLVLREEATNEDGDSLGVTLLHICRILHVALKAPRPPPLPLDPLVHVLASLVSRYLGPHQQKILLSAAGALVSSITCGHGTLSRQINTKYLYACYSLMNMYYARVVSFASTLRTNRCNVGYTLRFLFLLSEFLRLYPGWKYHDRELVSVVTTTIGTAAATGTVVPNKLASGDGICANIYSAVELVLRECPEVEQGRTAVIALRVMGSLCMLQPEIYLHRCEPCLRRAVDPASDVQQQLQGLVFIRDFLRDEEVRVQEAALASGEISVTQLRANTTGGTPPAPYRDCPRPSQLRVCEEMNVEEQNSGMAVWLLQQFHDQVVLLCGSSVLAVRELALEILQVCDAGELLPLPRYAKALIVLGADPQNTDIRMTAVACALEHCDRHEELMAASATAGIVRAFDLHAVCGVDVVKSAIVTPDRQRYQAQGEVEQCVHAYLFKSLQKKCRDAVISSLISYFHEETRANQWMQEHILEPGNEGSASRGSKHLMEVTADPLPFLAHLTVVIAHMPYQLDSDVIHVLNSCRSVIDLNVQDCMEFVERQLALLRGNGKVEGRGKAVTGTVTTSALQVWRCYGVLCALHLSAFLHSAYDLRAVKRHCGVGRSVARLSRSDSQRAASAALLSIMGELTCNTGVLWSGKADAKEWSNNHKIQSMETIRSALASATGLGDASAPPVCQSALPAKVRATIHSRNKAKKRCRSQRRLSGGVCVSSSSSSSRATSVGSL